MKLKKCPFCGHKPTLLGDVSFWVRCTHCHVETDLYDTVDEAAEVWNTRTKKGKDGKKKAREESLFGWIENNGEPPGEPEQLVEVILRDGRTIYGFSINNLRWSFENFPSDIIKWRFVDELPEHQN